MISLLRIAGLAPGQADSASRLAEHPKLGRPGRIPGTRELVAHAHYRLVYEINDDTVWILTIQAAFPASCQIEEQVDMQWQDGQIVIKPVERKLRAGWFEPAPQPATAVLAQERAEAQDWSDASIADDSEWVW